MTCRACTASFEVPREHASQGPMTPPVQQPPPGTFGGQPIQPLPGSGSFMNGPTAPPSRPQTGWGTATPNQPSVGGWGNTPSQPISTFPAQGQQPISTFPPQGQQPISTFSQPQAASVNPLAIVSLVTGILCCFPLPIVALITGFIAKNQIAQSGGRQSGDGLAIAGMVLGGLSLLLNFLALIGNLVK